MVRPPHISDVLARIRRTREALDELAATLSVLEAGLDGSRAPPADMPPRPRAERPARPAAGPTMGLTELLDALHTRLAEPESTVDRLQMRAARRGPAGAPLAAALRQVLDTRRTPLSLAQIAAGLVRLGVLPARADAERRTLDILKTWGPHCGIEETAAGTYRLVSPRDAAVPPAGRRGVTSPATPTRPGTRHSRDTASHGRFAPLR